MSSKMELTFQKNNIGLGRRKQAIARVFILPGEGNITINKKAGDRYLQYNDTYLNTVWSPLKTLNLEKQFDIVALSKRWGFNRPS
jgi:small subunit ribosomal protein S9